MSSNHPPANNNGDKQRRRKRRWGDATEASSAAAAAPPLPSTPAPSGPIIDSKAKALALQESIRARLAALKAKTGAAVSVPQAPPMSAASGIATLKRPPPSSGSDGGATTAPSTKRAKHYELDMTSIAPTFNKKPEPPKPKINPYLAHRHQTENADQSTSQTKSSEGIEESNGISLEEESSEIIDDRVQAEKVRKRHKALKFVEPGTFVEVAERKRRKAANAEQSGFASGRKAGTYFTSQSMANIYGSTEVHLEDDDGVLAARPEANEKTNMPYVVEWWDLELLPSKLKKQVAAYEGKSLQRETQSQMQHQLESKIAASKLEALQDSEAQNLHKSCMEQAALSYSKTAALIQHIVPIKPPNAKDGPSAEPTLYLTKKELKRQRKLRREEKQRDLRDMQAAGLVAAPEPRLTLKNFIRVLGDQAFVDPSQMEQKVMAQMEARQRAHLERNEQNKLTKEQRKAKLAKKLKEDTSQGVHVALFHVKDMSHPYHRTKVDLNAQQYNVTGGVLETESPQLACVICEGGPKAIKRYIRLMTVRMKWKGPENAEDDDEDEEQAEEFDEEGNPIRRPKFNPDNRCELVWTGMATKRFFKGFVFQACESGLEAAKILRAKGVGHFWDQILAHVSGKEDQFQLKLADENSDDDEPANQDDNNMNGYGDDGDVTMTD